MRRFGRPQGGLHLVFTQNQREEVKVSLSKWLRSKLDRPKDPRISPGELLIIECGLQIGGGESTSARAIRVLNLEEASARQREVYQALVQVLFKCLETIKPGVNVRLIAETARRSLVESGYGDYGYWNFAEPFLWVMSDRWQAVSEMADFAVKQDMVLAVEPSVRIPQLNTRLMKMSESEAMSEQDVLKVGTMIHVTNTGYELLGEGPAEIGA